VIGEEGLDFRELVEPADGVCGGLAVFDAGIEVFPDVPVEACDLFVSRHRYKPCRLN